MHAKGDKTTSKGDLKPEKVVTEKQIDTPFEAKVEPLHPASLPEIPGNPHSEAQTALLHRAL